jgi:hypothetical protein
VLRGAHKTLAQQLVVLRDRFGFPLEAARTYADYLSEAKGGAGDFDRRFRFDT